MATVEATRPAVELIGYFPRPWKSHSTRTILPAPGGVAALSVKVTGRPAAMSIRPVLAGPPDALRTERFSTGCRPLRWPAVAATWMASEFVTVYCVLAGGRAPW